MKNKDAKSLTPESKDPVTFADVLDLDLNKSIDNLKNAIAQEKESVGVTAQSTDNATNTIESADAATSKKYRFGACNHYGPCEKKYKKIDNRYLRKKIFAHWKRVGIPLICVLCALTGKGKILDESSVCLDHEGGDSWLLHLRGLYYRCIRPLCVPHNQTESNRIKREHKEIRLKMIAKGIDEECSECGRPETCKICINETWYSSDSKYTVLGIYWLDSDGDKSDVPRFICHQCRPNIKSKRDEPYDIVEATNIHQEDVGKHIISMANNKPTVIKNTVLKLLECACSYLFDDLMDGPTDIIGAMSPVTYQRHYDQYVLKPNRDNAIFCELKLLGFMMSDDDSNAVPKGVTLVGMAPINFILMELAALWYKWREYNINQEANGLSLISWEDFQEKYAILLNYDTTKPVPIDWTKSHYYEFLTKLTFDFYEKIKEDYEKSDEGKNDMSYFQEVLEKMDVNPLLQKIYK